MGSRKGTVDKFAPVRGLITEASDMNFPQDAAYDLDNVEIDKDGRVLRRLGLAPETDGGALLDDFTEDDRKNGTFSNFLWRVTAGAQEVDVRVIQTGKKLTFREDKAPLSNQAVVLEINLEQSPYTTGRTVDTPCQYAYGAGFLLITNQDANTLIVRSVGSTVFPLNLQAEPIVQQVRTQTLLPGFNAGDNYGTSLSAVEEFNLRNSGWPYSATVANDQNGSGVSTSDPIQYYRNKRGTYPTHSRVYSAMRLSSATSVDAVDSFSPWADLKIAFGNTLPPLGHYVHSAFSFDARSLMESEGSPISSGNFSYTISNRPICCAFLNGHAIYGDIDQNNKARIMVSQLVKETDSLKKCYQEADPTASEINDLVATDGFVVRPVGMGKPLAMRETSKAVVILCTNGVWALRSAGGPFSATNYEVVKLASLDFNAPNSVAVVDDVVFFCADKGIYSIIANQFGELQVANLTDDTIKTLYQDYGVERIHGMHAAYIKAENYIYWLVPDAPENGLYKGDSYEALIFNLTLQGFFVYSFGRDTTRPALHMPMALTNSTSSIVDEPVTIDGGTENVFADGELVTAGQEVVSQSQEGVAFLASYRQSGVLQNRVAALTSLTLKDWYELGLPYTFSYKSFIEFAYVPPTSFVGGVAAPYIHSFFEQGRVDGSFLEAPIVPTQEVFRVNQAYVQILEKL